MKDTDVSVSTSNSSNDQEYYHEINAQRMISVPSSALGTLRQELIDTVGLERAKGFLLRYGWNCGVSDGLKMKEKIWDNERDLLLAGPKLHSLNGHVQVQPMIIKFDFNKGTIHFEGNWLNSYEAEEHIKLYGHSDHTVCHTLVGYASGYLSTVMGKKVIAKETQCIGTGSEHCHWICKTVDEWNEDAYIKKELQFYEANSIVDELDETYEKLRIERDNLSKTYQIHRKLVKEVLHETGLKSIADVLYQTLQIPVFIEGLDFKFYEAGGLSPQEAQHYSNEFKEWVDNQVKKKGQECKEVKQTQFLDISSGHKRLITPIFIRQNVYGYCSLMYNETMVNEVDKMVLEQAALACSLHLQNEKTRFNAEQAMRGSFLEDILNKQISMDEIVKRSHYIDFQLNKPYFMVAIKSLHEVPSLEEKIEFNDQFMNDLLTFLKTNRVNGLLGQRLGNVIILFSESTLFNSNMKKESFCRQLLDYCSTQYPQLFFKLGISSSLPSIEEASNLYDESIASLKVTNRHQNLVFFDSLGLVGMLLQTKNLDTIEKFAYKVLGKLIEEDQNKNLELTKTLYYYLDKGSNVHKTARAMNLSISGLRYRLGRLNEILQLDINTPYIRHEIYLALQSLIVLGELDID